MDKITLLHGEGGKKTKELIETVFKEYFDHDTNLDSSLLRIDGEKLAFTTDSFVVKPRYFPGGNIGTLCVNGTVNDLITSGSIPLYLTCSMIIEEGFLLEELNDIVKSISTACKKANVKVVTGDTKVVARGECDGIYINTSGIGVVKNQYEGKELNENDAIIATGPIGDHGCVIIMNRYHLDVESNLISDCAPLTRILTIVDRYTEYIKVMKDITRGGVATIVNEIADYSKHNIELFDTEIPIRNEVRAISCLLGIDPLYLACEGRMLLVVSEAKAYEVLWSLKKITEFQDAEIIGRVRKSDKFPVVSTKTPIGGRRILPPLDDLILPRIC